MYLHRRHHRPTQGRAVAAERHLRVVDGRRRPRRRRRRSTTRCRNDGPPWFAVSPLMHAAGLWTAFSGVLAGLPVVLYDDRTKFDPQSVWQTAEREKVGLMTMVGDAYAGTADRGTRPQPATTCPRCSPSEPAARQPTQNISGPAGACCRSSPSSTATAPRRPATWASGTTSAAVASRDLRPSAKAALVLSDDYDRFLAPGEAEVGWVARTGRIPLGYFDDAEATRKTFPVVDGQRVVVSGDRASLRGRRHAAAVRPGLAGGQHRRREGLRRRGRGGAAGAPRGRRRAGGRPATASGGARRSWRSSQLHPGDDVDRRGACAALHRASWRGSRRPRSSSSSRRSAGSATARPTTGGRRAHSRRTACERWTA